MNESDRRSPEPQAPDASVDEAMNVTEWAHRQAPHLSEVSNSNPSATLRRHNLVAITDDIEAARVVALDFERTTDADTDTTMVVLGHAVDREAKHQADPEGITSHAARRSLLGGLPGAAIFALIIGLGVWFATGSGAAAGAAAVGAAVFGFYSTAVWSFVIGTGQSRAYQQGFIDPEAADAIVVALHVNDRDLLEQARTAVQNEDKIRLFDVDSQGRLLQ